MQETDARFNFVQLTPETFLLILRAFVTTTLNISNFDYNEKCRSLEAIGWQSNFNFVLLFLEGGGRSSLNLQIIFRIFTISRTRQVRHCLSNFMLIRAFNARTDAQFTFYLLTVCCRNTVFFVNSSFI